METVTEKLLHEERKLNERETSVTLSEKVLLGKKAKKARDLVFCATNLDILRNSVKNLIQANRKTAQKANIRHI